MTAPNGVKSGPIRIKNSRICSQWKKYVSIGSISFLSVPVGKKKKNAVYL